MTGFRVIQALGSLVDRMAAFGQKPSRRVTLCIFHTCAPSQPDNVEVRNNMVLAAGGHWVLVVSALPARVPPTLASLDRRIDTLETHTRGIDR